IDRSTVSPAETQAEMAAYGAFTQEITERGLFKGGEALEPTSTATTVRVRDGRNLVTDGPFAETKEALGGYYLLDCKDLDEDFDLAEEAVQEAFVVALERWPRVGVPENPGAWIITAARNKAIDRIRRARRLVDKQAALASQAQTETPDPETLAVETEDEMSPI